jgi:hypothetical protein
MAIPTQFSVAKKRQSPVANPIQPIDKANSINAESASSISTPAALIASAGTQTSGTFPLNHARILYDNLLFNYDSVTQNNSGVPINALIPSTAQKWEFSVSGEDALWSVILASETLIDTVCICAHNLFDIGATVQVNYDPEPLGGYIAFGVEKTPVRGNAPIMIHLGEAVQSIRLQIQVKGGNGIGAIGYISAGIALQMQRPFFNGHQPYTDSDVTEYYNAKSESGNILNRDVRRKGFEASYEWSNIDDGWYRTYIPDLKEKAKKQPMVLAWNLLEYPDDVAFGMTTADIKAPMQNGTVTKRGGFGFTLVGV